VQAPTGTIDGTVYDGLGQVVSTWVGTNVLLAEMVAVGKAEMGAGIRPSTPAGFPARKEGACPPQPRPPTLLWPVRAFFSRKEKC
jgi:hypothetical protein